MEKSLDRIRHVTMSFAIIIILLKTVMSSENTLVTTINGKIQGKIENVDGVEVREWLGIPYAKPPTEKLRFKRPEPVDNWVDDLKATSQPKVCFQTGDSGYMVLKKTFHMWNPKGEMSEDCLYLNIYAPKERKGTKYPTLLWLHGGGFYKGAVSLEQYNPKILVAKHDVIVVTIQYRLGVFGFLYFNDTAIPGNMGLLDQTLAIRWISENIDSFGGNKSDITLMGESAGSASVGYHMISKKSRHLFQKAIMQSGSPFCFWGYAEPYDSFNRSRLFAAYAKCQNKNFTELHECLMNKPAEDLIKSDESILALAPTIDGDFIDMSPFDAIQLKEYSSKPVLGGLVQNEGMPGIEYFLRQVMKPNYTHFTEEDMTKFITMLSFYANIKRTKLVKIAENYYPHYSQKGKVQLEQVATHLFGDYFISCGAIDFLSNISTLETPVYFYYFNHRWENNPDPSYTEVMHGSEIQFQFGRPFDNKFNYTDSDRRISEKVMSLWSEFAKSSKPEKSWNAYLGSSSDIYEIKGESERTVVKRRENFCAYWKQYKSRFDSLLAKQVRNFMKEAVTIYAGGYWAGTAAWAWQQSKYKDVW